MPLDLGGYDSARTLEIIKSRGMAAEALVHRVLQKAMNDNDVTTGEFLAAGHLVLDEFSTVADEFEV